MFECVVTKEMWPICRIIFAGSRTQMIDLCNIYQCVQVRGFTLFSNSYSKFTFAFDEAHSPALTQRNMCSKTIERCHVYTQDSVVDILVEELGISVDKAREIIRDMEDILNRDLLKLRERLQALKSAGVAPEIVLTNPLLWWIDDDKLWQKIDELCRTLHLDIACAAPLLNIEDNVQNYIKKLYHEDLRLLSCNRFHFFSDILSVPLFNSCSWLKQNVFMLGLSTERIVEHCNFLRKHNISLKEMRNHPKIFQHTFDSLENTVQELKSRNVKDIKCWMFSSSYHHLSGLFNEAYFFHIVTFASVLQCNETLILDMCLKWPRINKIALERLLILCYILEKEGISRRLVIRCPSILWLTSPKRLKERIVIMRNTGFTSEEIEYACNVLIQNNSRFTSLIAQRYKSKGKTRG